MKSKQMQLRYINRGVGVLVLMTVILFAAAVLLSGRFQQWLDPGARLKVIMPFESLSGLSEGAAVEVLGTKAGVVKEIVIAPDKQIHAAVQIQSNIKDFIRRDSKVVIRKQFGVAGAAYLDISRGSGQPLDWEYAVLSAQTDRAPTNSIDQMITDLRNKIFPVIDETQKAIQNFSQLLAELQNPEGNIQLMLANLTAISGKINKQSKDLPQMTKKLNAVLASVDAIMKDLSQTTPQLPGIAKNMGDATDSVPVLILQTQQVTAELEQLLKQLQSSWLLGGKGGGKPRESTRISPLKVRP